ncbi:DUF885 family protein [Candidatus Omnitrophota bacterium]
MANRQLRGSAKDYFAFMSRQYPVLCMSDEFYLMPRAGGSSRFLDSLEEIDAGKIRDDIRSIKKIKQRIKKLRLPDDRSSLPGLEDHIGARLLEQSINSYLFVFEHAREWRSDPAFYIKIALFGVEQPLDMLSPRDTENRDQLILRIKKIPSLFKNAGINLDSATEGRLNTALRLGKNAVCFFSRLHETFSGKNDARSRDLASAILKAISSMEEYMRFIRRMRPRKNSFGEKELLENMLYKCYSCRRSLDEIFDIAYKEYETTLCEMDTAATLAKPALSWRAVLSKYRMEVRDTEELLRLYTDQMRRIRGFLLRSNIVTIPETGGVLIRETPPYLAPIRASASYRCPAAGSGRQPAYFYISPYFKKRHPGSKRITLDNLHHEYIFVTAHETYPGHHLLDSYRMRSKDPIRRQIESPMFYEGWASYAEGLIDELGYIKDPRQRLFGLKRRAWRAIRAMLDVGLRTNKLTLNKAGSMFLNIGYTPKVVKAMLEHYPLTIGYQLCYTIGKFEIEELRRRFIGGAGLKRFNELLLKGGQIPFDLAGERLERIIWKKNS